MPSEMAAGPLTSPTTVIVVNTFKDKTPEGDIGSYHEHFERMAEKVISFTVNSSLHKENTIIFVSSNQNLVEHLQFDTSIGGESRVPKVHMLDAPSILPNGDTKSKTSLHVLAAALSSLEIYLPSHSQANILFLTPPGNEVFAGFQVDEPMKDTDSDEEVPEVMTEILSYFDNSSSTNNIAIQRCKFLVLEGQQSSLTPSSPIIQLLHKQQLISNFPHESSHPSTSTVWSERFSTERIDMSESSFKYICQQVLSWNFTPKSLTINMQNHKLNSDSMNMINSQSMSVYCDLIPTVWTKKSWWHEGLAQLQYQGTISMKEIDAVRLGCSFSVSPITSSSNSKLPMAAISENRCVFAAICEHLSEEDSVLVFECQSAMSFRRRSPSSNQVSKERWILHCDPSSSWDSATLQQIIPQELLVSSVSERSAQLSAQEKSRVVQLKHGVSEFLSSFKCCNLDSLQKTLFDEQPLQSQHQNSYSSHWLADYQVIDSPSMANMPRPMPSSTHMQVQAIPTHINSNYNDDNNTHLRSNHSGFRNPMPTTSHPQHCQQPVPQVEGRTEAWHAPSRNFSPQEVPAQRSWGRASMNATAPMNRNPAAPIKGKLPLFSFKK